MTKFNVGKFNVDGGTIFSVTGVSDIALDSEVKSVLVEKDSGVYASSITIDSSAEYHVEIVNITGEAEIEFSTFGLAANLVYSDAGNSSIELNSYAIGSLLGEDYVEISGLVLRPGQEVEIDMCNLTVTVNGENAMHLMSPDGDFFDFLIGNNEIDIEATGAGTVSVDTYWKDRWL